MFSYKLFAAFFIVFIISVESRSLFQSFSLSSSVTTQVINGKYMIAINNGDCIYKQGKIIEDESIRSMTIEEKAKVQKFLDGEIDVPCFCTSC